jgi:hypothetical protein
MPRYHLFGSVPLRAMRAMKSGRAGEIVATEEFVGGVGLKGIKAVDRRVAWNGVHCS